MTRSAGDGRVHGWFVSSLPGMTWPAIPSAQGTLLGMLLRQFAESQWLGAEEIEARQLAQLRLLLAHAKRHSRFFAERLRNLDTDRPMSLHECLAGLPIMHRQDLQNRRREIDCAWYPSEHGGATVGKSTGSTGEPVAVRRTALNNLIWMAMTLREHLWQGRDFGASLAVIRANSDGDKGHDEGIVRTDWGPPVNELLVSGPSYGLSLQTDIGRQVAWLRDIGPDYLLTYPSNLDALLDEAEADPLHRAGLGHVRQVRTIGETLADALRQRCRDLLHAEIADTYSTQEVGVLAAECPMGGGYHVMAEGVIIEILDDDDRPCAPGTVGRVVATDLHNFATPLIRYDLRDIAEMGSPCRCGRGLPRLTRILGRQRNLVHLPDGRRYWPLTGAYGYRDIAPVRQYQVIQRSLERVTLRLAAERSLTPGEEAALANLLGSFLGHPFAVDFEYFPDGIPRGRGGKFEDFICELPANTTA